MCVEFNMTRGRILRQRKHRRMLGPYCMFHHMNTRLAWGRARLMLPIFCYHQHSAALHRMDLDDGFRREIQYRTHTMRQLLHTLLIRTRSRSLLHFFFFPPGRQLGGGDNPEVGTRPSQVPTCLAPATDQNYWPKADHLRGMALCVGKR